jgi:metallo-beta-lactamase class B
MEFNSQLGIIKAPVLSSAKDRTKMRREKAYMQSPKDVHGNDERFETVMNSSARAPTADICIHPWRYRVQPFRIVNNLYYVGNSNVSSHLIDTGQGLILLDTTFPQTVYLVLESIRRLGFNPDDIRYVLHSHGHYDHFGGTKAIVELTGAATALGKDDVTILVDRPELSYAPEYGVEFHETFHVDKALSDGDTVSLGNTTIRCVHIPGHTRGSMSYFFNVSHEGRKYTVANHGGPGINTLSNKYLERYGLSEDRRRDYLNSLKKLEKRTVDIFIAIHPSQNDTLKKRRRIARQNNPFIDSQAWPTFLHTLQAKFAEAFSPASGDLP